MFSEFKKPVEEISFSKIFFISSIILILSIFWTIYDEVFTRREWKKYQAEFIKLEYEKTSQELKLAEDYLNSHPAKQKYSELQNKLNSALDKLKTDEYKNAKKEYEKSLIELNKPTRNFQFIKSKLDELDYEYYIAKHNERNLEPIKTKIEQLKEKLNSANKDLLEKQVVSEKLKEKLVEFTDNIKKLTNEITKLTLDVDRLKEKIKSIRAKKFNIKIEQIIVDPLKRIDRCNTCHMAILKEGYTEYKEPFKSHPGEYLKLHPSEKFGCTVCHYGQGLATTLPDAHGNMKYWSEPMYKKEYIQASCAKCHEGIKEPQKEYKLPPEEIIEVNMKNMEVINKGRKLFKELGCIGCHAINGKGGNISVDIGEIADKSIEELDFMYITKEHSVSNWLYEHFLNPQKITKIRPLPGIIYDSPMPNYNLSKEDASVLTALMLSFTSEKKKIPHYYYKDKVSVPVQHEIKYASKIERGKAIFEKYGCHGCHGKNGSKGIPNYNRQGGKIPELTKVGESYTADELKDKIRKGVLSEPKEDPNGPTPPLFMPAWKDLINDRDLDDLVTYLISLLPTKSKDEW